MAATPTIYLVGRIAHQPAGHVDAYGDGEEFFHLAQAAELPQHDLAEHQLAGSGAQRRGHGIKQHRQRQRDEQEILHRELHDAHLKLGDQLGKKGGQAIQRHGQNKDHPFLGLAGRLLVDRFHT